MIVTIESVAHPSSGDGYRDVIRYAYQEEEPLDMEVRGDSLQDANHALEIIDKLTVRKSILKGEPPRGEGYDPMYIIQIKVFDTHKTHARYAVSYQKFNGCPLNVIEDMMKIHARIKKNLRELAPRRSKKK